MLSSLCFGDQYIDLNVKFSFELPYLRAVS
jgi:hypothetical protein